jgi:pimeloyl-ACP methyl ester carboxylesterase
MQCIEDAIGQSRLPRRHLLGGLSLAALSASLPSFVKAAVPAGKHLFTLQDAFDRTDLQAIVGSPTGDAWALQLLRPISAGGLYGETAGWASHFARAEIWLADATLDTCRKISGATSWDWSPCFSPSGRALAFITSVDGARARLSVRRQDGKLVHFAASSSCELAVVMSDGRGDGLPFAWLGNEALLYVADRTKPYQPGLMANGEPVERSRAWAEMRVGGASVHVWDDNSQTCGALNSLLRLDVRTGKTTALLQGDVRGVALSPDRRFAACLVADRHVSLTGAGIPKIAAPVHFEAPANWFDYLVQLSLQIVDIERGKIARVSSFQSVGGVTTRELPRWSSDSTTVATVRRSALDENEASYQVHVVAADGAAVATHDASSQLDAEIVAGLVAAATSRTSAAQRIGRRLQIADIDRWPPTSFVRQAGAYLYAFNGADAYQFGPEEDIKLDKDRAAPGVPTVLQDGRMLAYGVGDGVLKRWVLDRGRVTIESDALPDPELQPTGTGPRGQVACVAATNDGTFFWSGTQNGLRKGGFSLNRHLAKVAVPQAAEVVYANARGEQRTGILFLPSQHIAGERRPVVMWAYPDHKPSLKGSLCRLNGNSATYAYPFLSLLAAGFAVFWAAFPVAGGREEPVERVRSEIFPAVEMLNKHPAIAPGRIGFFGHSNAGYVALTLAGQTDAFKAIVAYSTFPEWGDAEFMTFPGVRWMSCGGFVAQSARYYIEDPHLPYAMGTARWNDEAKFARNTPIDHLHKAKTPVLFLQGEFDVTPVPMESAYHILQANGVPSAFAYYRGESHVLYSPANIRDATERSVRWFQTHLRE